MNHEIPRDHPRYKSLQSRLAIERGVAQGITALAGLAAHGRGEAFDYLLGETSHTFSLKACEAAAALLLQAKSAVISVNGNSAMLVAESMIQLADAAGAQIEINLFHNDEKRRELIGARFAALGRTVLGIQPDASIPGLSSARAMVDSRGMLVADVVLVALEDGDRTEALVAAGKKVIAVDLNPLSRTPRAAQISIIDNVERALPIVTEQVEWLKNVTAAARESILLEFDNAAILREAEHAIRLGAR